MVHRALLVGVAAAAADFPRLPHEYPVPPIQTDTQKKIFAQTAAAAKQASEAATPQVLAFFDSQEFREAMKACCPSVASMTSQAILDKYRAEARAAELAHAFPASATSGSHFIDLTIEAAFEYPWFINEVQARLIDNNTKARSQNEIEEAIFGSVPFQIDQKPTWEEAADRLIYVASNMREFDFGSCTTFGDVTAVFDADYVKDMVVIAPMDTGLYWMHCRGSSQHHWGPQPNCSAWPSEVVGTLDHLDHLILPNLAYFYNSSESGQTIIDGAKAFFSHSAFDPDYASLPNITSAEVLMYLESNVMGNPRMAGGVKFLIGNFATLFGTDLGHRLQELAAYYAWPLFWAYGSGVSSLYTTVSLPGNRRIGDPVSVTNLTNVTPVPGQLASFESTWGEATSARAAQGGNVTAAQLQMWWGALEGSQVRVAPVTSASCVDTAHCVAIEVHSGQCICTKGSDQALLV